MMLILEKCIGKGATRECYRHPADASKCVKVLIKNTDTSILKRELKYYIVSEILLNGFSLYDSLIYYVNKVSNDFAELKKIYNENGTYSTKIKSDKDIALGKIYFLHCPISVKMKSSNIFFIKFFNDYMQMRTLYISFVTT